MIHRKHISEEQARGAMERGEFGDEVTASRPYVAVILTQDWCPQWPAMQRWMSRLEKPTENSGVPEIDVYDLEYNRLSFAVEFMRYKEQTLGNDLIPYVRYYVDGSLVGESNFVMRDAFLKHFKE